MMAQVGAGEAMDLVTAALHLAAEDDAIKTRTHIPLPVESFSARLDVMVAVRVIIMLEWRERSVERYLYGCRYI